MNFNGDTLAILKNFASINSGVVLQTGKVQKTISPEKNIMVEAELEDTIPEQFGIYDLNRFIGNLTTLKNPDLEFSKQFIVMNDGSFTLHYHACSPNLIITPPDKELVLKSVDVAFDLDNTTLQKLLKLASMNGLPNLSVIGKEGDLLLKIHESANDTSNYGTIKFGLYAGKDFVATFKTENLKLLPMDYKVELQVGAFARFKSIPGNLTYYIALEAGGKNGG